MNEKDLQDVIEFLIQRGLFTKIKLSDIPKQTIDKITSLGIGEIITSAPEICEVNDCSSYYEMEITDEDTIVLKCERGHSKKVKIEEYKYLNLNFERLFNLLGKYFPSFKFESDKGNMLIGSSWHEGTPFKIYFVINLDEKNILNEFKHILLSKSPTVIIVNDRDLDKYINSLGVISMGNFVYLAPLTKIRKLRNDIKNWMNKVNNIIKTRSKLLNELRTKEKHLRILEFIENNPKYLISLLNHLKVLKIMRRENFDWELMELLTALSFSYLFMSSPDYWTGEKFRDVPDNAFIILDEKKEPNFIGLVDCKSSTPTKIRREKTEKYLNYLERVRSLKGYSVSKLKGIGLILIVFEINEKDIIDFYQRISTHLRENEFLIVMTVSALEILIDSLIDIIYVSNVSLDLLSRELSEHMIKLFTSPNVNSKYAKLIMVDYNEIQNFITNIQKRLIKKDTRRQFIKDIYENRNDND